MQVTRRNFIKTAAASTAALSALPISRSAYAGGSDVIKIGLVGCGERGSGAVVNACNADPGVRLVAMGDLFQERLEKSLGNLQKAKAEQISVDKDHQFVGFDAYSGDDVIQSLVHNLDRATWALHEQTPLKAHGMGGRSSSFGEVYGDVFDHHAVVYEYANGIRLYAFCRTEVGCYDESSSIILGSKGQANLTRHFIKGEKNWHYEGPPSNPYDLEHKELFKAIRAGEPLNNGDYMARSTQVVIMGQLSCYSGKEITWGEICGSDFAFLPQTGDFETQPSVTAKDGIYPCATPGVTDVKGPAPATKG